MDWLSTFTVVALVAGAVCIAVMAVVAYDLRRHLQCRLDEIAERQAQHSRRIAEGLASLRRDQRDAEARLEAIARSHRKLSGDIADLYDRLGSGAAPAAGDRVLH